MPGRNTPAADGQVRRMELVRSNPPRAIPSDSLHRRCYRRRYNRRQAPFSADGVADCGSRWGPAFAANLPVIGHNRQSGFVHHPTSRKPRGPDGRAPRQRIRKPFGVSEDFVGRSLGLSNVSNERFPSSCATYRIVVPWFTKSARAASSAPRFGKVAEPDI